ncbi:hypothetical protein RYX36_021411, partial [Vicia faba]
MKPTYSQGRIKTCACKNATPAMEVYVDKGSDCEVFINVDIKKRFTDSILKWVKFFQKSSPYNTHLVKQFYSNPSITNMKKEVMEKYQEILDRADEDEYEVYMQSLCNP